MYPDLHDVELAMRSVSGSPKQAPETIWQDVVLIRSFLDESRGCCYSHGRHQFMLVSELKKIAESFISRSVSDYAFRVAMHMQTLNVKSSGTDKQLLVKFPPLDRFEEVRELWNQRQRILEHEIAEEIQRMEAEKQNFRARIELAA
jgi:hypothetical protein